MHEIQLRSGRVLNEKLKSSVIIREEDEEDEALEEPISNTIFKDVVIPEIPNLPPIEKESTQNVRTPPFPEHLTIEKTDNTS